MRNLVVCLDGTWNTPDQMDRGRQVPSNVVKMARAVKDNSTAVGPDQLVYYDTGVGTKGIRDKYIGGGTGKGITQNIFEAYDWLCENYQEEDRVFLFGFSRGAYTARSLAGIIGLCGLAKPLSNDDEHIKMLEEIEDKYRISDKKKRQGATADFKNSEQSRVIDVHFIGVWDTVGALGVPTSGLIGWFTRKISKFHDVTLGEHIQHAYHALAINEKRGPFQPCLWEPKEPVTGGRTLVQAWFPGVHSNVGGGYADTGLSDRCLLWMIRNAERHGLETDRNYIIKRLDPNWFGELRNTLTWKYKLMFGKNKARYRDIGKARNGNEYLHMSCQGRWSHNSRPDEPPENYTGVKTSVPVLEEDPFEGTFNNLGGPDRDGNEKVA